MILRYFKKTYHRNLLEDLIKKHSSLIKGEILDVGSKDRRYDKWFFGNIAACDIEPNLELKIEKQDIVKLTYPHDFFDWVLCFEVLEYLESGKLETAILEIKRVLKKQGRALISCPFFYKDHNDRIRYSKNYLTKVLGGLDFSDLQIKAFGNKFTAEYDMIWCFFWENRRKSFLRKLFAFFVLLPILFVELLFIKILFLEKIKDDFYSGLFIDLSK